jgi:alcohol dehydrogenase class IV
MLPHVMRFNLDAAPEAKARLQDALGSADPAAAVAAMLKKFPIPQRLRDVGFDPAKADFVAGEIATAKITAPRPASASDVRELLTAAY